MKSSILLKLLFVFVWPFPAFISVFKDLKSRYLLLFFMFFAAFVGINMYNAHTSDMYKYVTYSVYYKNSSLSAILLEKDFFYPLLSKIVNSISSNFYFVTVSFTTIYYFLFYKCIKVISDNLNPEYKTYVPWFYVLALYTVLPFTVVTAFRFNSAVLFFSWCLLEYTLNKKKKFLYIILLTPFIHFSFLFYSILPFIYLAIKNLKNRMNIVIILFILSFVYSNSNVSAVVDNLSKQYLRESISNQVDAYASEEGIESNNVRYAKAVKKGSTKRAINRGIIAYSRQILMFSLLFFILRRKKFLAQNPFYEDLLLMALLSYSLTNFASSVLHGSRFFSVSNFYFYFVLFYMITSTTVSFEQNKAFYLKNKKIFHFISLLIVLNFFNFAYMAKTIFNFPNLIFGNWLSTYFLISG
jgi:hypothetical protein